MARYRPLSAGEIQLLATQQRAYNDWEKLRAWAVGWYGPLAARLEIEGEFEGDGEEGTRFHLLRVYVLDADGDWLSLDPDAPRTRAALDQYHSADRDEDGEEQDEESLDDLLALIEDEDDTYLDERNDLPLVDGLVDRTSFAPWPAVDLTEEPKRRWAAAYVREDDEGPAESAAAPWRVAAEASDHGVGSEVPHSPDVRDPAAPSEDMPF
jgi:hypothetical protein